MFVELISMTDEIGKILTLQEEMIVLQRTSHNTTLEATKKIYRYKTIVMALLLITFLSLAYALSLSLIFMNRA